LLALDPPQRFAGTDTHKAGEMGLPNQMTGVGWRIAVVERIRVFKPAF
jgi:hypothetical protein